MVHYSMLAIVMCGGRRICYTMTFDVQLGVAQGCSLSLSVFGLLEQAGH